MNKKLKFILKNRSSEQGFAIPIAVGMGLVMLLIGTTMIVRSQGDEVTASAQKATNRGLSAAETAITRYQSLIYKNRVIATYKDCDGARNSNGVCPDTGIAKSWANATTISGLSSSCGGGSGGGATPVANASTIAWQDVNSSNQSLGQYRLVSYVYPAPGTTGTTGTAPGIGQLTVEGRVNQSGSGITATTGAGTATTRLQVKIPVEQGDLSTVPIPGLWLKSGTMPGNQTTKGNILLNDCFISPAPTDTTNQELDPVTNLPYIDPATGQPYKTKQVSFNLPDLPSEPTYITSPNNQVLGDITSDQTLPRVGDKSNTGVSYPTASGLYPQPSTGVFEYSVGSITGNNVINIRTTPGIKVKFYLHGNIAKQADFRHNCTSIAGCDPTDFQIFGYGGSGSSICLNGNGLIDAFIFAPAYSAGVDGNGQFRGSVWVNDFNAPSCSSSSNHLVVVQLASWSSLGLTPQGLPPKLSPLSSWQRQETP
ncbi:MAG: hypothetical protein KME05_23835 [Gloeocapsa sp. UFS-A4-WI-NPMV-4B04]|jgi:hypothetical protein|nr:hypothetical protein [Gloeocapsa sp. UFS-A4-WI-NPMV-4B04]